MVCQSIQTTEWGIFFFFFWSGTKVHCHERAVLFEVNFIAPIFSPDGTMYEGEKKTAADYVTVFSVSKNIIRPHELHNHFIPDIN